MISGCQRSTQVSWLSVLANMTLPPLRRKAATDKMLQIIEVHQNCPCMLVSLSIHDHLIGVYPDAQ